LENEFPINTIQRILFLEKIVPNSRQHEIEVLNDEKGDYEFNLKQKTSARPSLLLTTPKPTVCLRQT